MANCPHCQTILTSRETQLPACPSCGKAMSATETATEITDFLPETASDRQRAARRTQPRSGNRRRFWLGITIVGLIVAGGGGWFFYEHYIRPDVWIYVDNGGKETFTVYIDDEPVEDVLPGQCRIVKCRHGGRLIRVENRSGRLFGERKFLAAPSSVDRPKRYVLNPGGTNRYWVREIHYGMSIPKFVTVYDQSTSAEYRRLAKQIDIVKHKGPWHDVPSVDYMLDDAIPSEVTGYFSDTRRAFLRIDNSSYALIDAAQTFNRKDVTQEELNAMERLVNRLNEID